MRRLLHAKVSTVLLLSLVACSADSPPLDQASPSPTVTVNELTATPSAAPVSVQQVINDTQAAGDARLSIRVEAKMPADFDDGQPLRSFSGRGFWDAETEVGGLNYRMDGVPNAAGYFGHAEGRVSVFYIDDGFLLSFPVLAEALPGAEDWFRYELSDFAVPQIRRLGIGQLREVGLSDPRVALALLEGLPDLLEGGRYKAVEETAATVFEVQADVAAVSDSAPPSVKAQVQGLLDLGVEQVEMELALDPLERIRRIRYQLSYAPAPGSKPVRLSVSVDLLEFGLEGGLTPPPARQIADYSDYIAR